MIKRLGKLRGKISGIDLRSVPKVLSSISCRHRAHNVFNAVLCYHRTPRFSETNRWHSESADQQCKIWARLSVGRCLSVSGDVQSHTAILETDGCAWMIAHMHRIDLSPALEQLPANCDQLFPAFPTSRPGCS